MHARTHTFRYIQTEDHILVSKFQTNERPPPIFLMAFHCYRLFYFVDDESCARWRYNITRTCRAEWFLAMVSFGFITATSRTGSQSTVLFSYTWELCEKRLFLIKVCILCVIARPVYDKTRLKVYSLFFIRINQVNSQLYIYFLCASYFRYIVTTNIGFPSFLLSSELHCIVQFSLSV